MEKVLKLLIDDFREINVPANYKAELTKYCQKEREFLLSLSEEQKKVYEELQHIQADMESIQQQEFAKFIHKYLKEIL